MIRITLISIFIISMHELITGENQKTKELKQVALKLPKKLDTKVKKIIPQIKKKVVPKQPPIAAKTEEVIKPPKTKLKFAKSIGTIHIDSQQETKI